jgi:multiple sugar transport system permease protein
VTASTAPRRAAAVAPRARRRHPARIHGPRLLPLYLIAPAIIYLLVFQGAPLVQGFRLAFSDATLFRPTQFDFVGLDNFADLVTDDGFWQALGVTVVYTLCCVVGTVAIGLGVALLMNREFRGRSVVRSLVIIPWAAPPVAIALIAVWMLDARYGIVNRALGAVHLAPPGGSWLDSPVFALPAILTVTIWQLFPFTAVVTLAALQAVPAELREAAMLDGANRRQQFASVTWPVIRPTVALLAILMTIWSIRRFELIWLMTQGGPVGTTNTLVIDLYRESFVIRDLGHGAAIGIVGLCISVAITIVYFVLSNRAERRGAAR